MYKFKSQACADLIMLGPQGDQLLRLLGREPAAKGIFDVAAMPAALAALEAAMAAEPKTAAPDANQDQADGAETAQPVVPLRQRLRPMVDMLRQAQAAGQPVVWGV